MIAPAHPLSPCGQMEALGYSFAPSRSPRCLAVMCRGAWIADLDPGEVAALQEAITAAQHDAHCAEPRRRAAAACLVELAAALDDAIPRAVH